jgi:phage shock protein PspC (stress-responsive transcriptional regulator)
MTDNGAACRCCSAALPAGARFCPSCGAAVAGPRELHRDPNRAQLAGVCAGLAAHFDVDPTLIRVLYLAGTFATGFVPGLLLYIVLAILVPRG